jgi:hypothetical protein
MRFQVLLVVAMKMAFLWVVVSCSPVEVYRHFRGTFCLHYKVIASSKEEFIWQQGAEKNICMSEKKGKRRVI